MLCSLLIPNTCWKCAFKTSSSCATTTTKARRKLNERRHAKGATSAIYLPNQERERSPPQDNSRHTRSPLWWKGLSRLPKKDGGAPVLSTEGTPTNLHVKNSVVTSEKEKSQRENESSLPAGAQRSSSESNPPKHKHDTARHLPVSLPPVVDVA